MLKKPIIKINLLIKIVKITILCNINLKDNDNKYKN